MEFWLAVIWNLAPFVVTLALYLVGVYWTRLHQSGKGLAVYLGAVLLFGGVAQLLWVSR